MAINGLLKQYSVGTVAVETGSTAVTGVSTFWAGNVSADDIFWLAGFDVRIASVNSPTSITLVEEWPGPDALAGSAYEIRFVLDQIGYAQRIRQLLDLLGNGNLERIAELVASDDISDLLAIRAEIEILASLEDGTVATGALTDLAAAVDQIVALGAVADDISTLAASIDDIQPILAIADDIEAVAANMAAIQAAVQSAADALASKNAAAASQTAAAGSASTAVTAKDTAVAAAAAASGHAGSTAADRAASAASASSAASSASSADADRIAAQQAREDAERFRNEAEEIAGGTATAIGFNSTADIPETNVQAALIGVDARARAALAAIPDPLPMAIIFGA